MHSVHKLAKYTALILISALPMSLDALADSEEKQAKVANINSGKADSINKQKILAEKFQALINEAKTALSVTRQASVSLGNNDANAAKLQLEDVLTKLDILLLEHPAMVMVPADVEVDVQDYEGDADTLQKAVKQADNLLDNGQLQSARRILAELASELRITTINIPLGTFPTAIKGAIALIDQQKNDEARALLDDVLNTLIEETEVTPLPVLRAEAFLNKASNVEHKEDMKKADSRAEVLKYTNAAKEELKIAVLLGYGKNADYFELYNVIDDIKNQIHTEKSNAAWEKVTKAFADLKNQLFSRPSK